MAQESERSAVTGVGGLQRFADLSGVRLDAAVLALATWSLFGVLLDVRNHDNGANFGLEGFVTLEHTIFYSGFAAIAVIIAVVTYANRSAGADWLDAIPEGYKLGLVGVVVFGLGGPGDALWHATFSAEQGVEALTSPTHLMLATGAVLFLSSPLRAAHRRGHRWGLQQLTTAVSATFVLTSITIITLYGHPVGAPAALTGEASMTLGVVSIMFQTAVLMGIVLVLVAEFRPSPGTFTLMLGINGIGMTWVGKSFVLLPGILAAGVVADLLYVGLEPGVENPRAFRAFAAAVPVVLFGLYFLSIELVGTIQWSVHVWAGSIVLAGFAGLLMSYVSLPAVRRPAADAR